MYIVHIASEIAPVAKVGGLGDVIYGLAQEMHRGGHQIEILLPKYDCLDYTRLQNLRIDTQEVPSFENLNPYSNTIWSCQLDGLKLLLLEPRHPSFYFSRGTIYGCKDDNDRFLYFCRLCMEFLCKTGRKPDIIHIHDWPTAAVALLYKEMYQQLDFQTPTILLTIHNLEHQGRCSVRNLTKIGLRGENYLTKDGLQDPLLPGILNLLKGGLKYADGITTVSPTYEQEIKTAEGGRGLHEEIKKYESKLKGILNGIDIHYWNPETDPFVPSHYKVDQISERQIEQVIKAKAANKEILREQLKLAASPGPLVAAITRLVPQKGPELIIAALKRTLEKKGQFVLLGSSPLPDITKLFVKLKKEYADHPHVAIHLDYNEPLSHLLYAASDLIIVPSLFEPCGLTQMIGLRYGTIPLVRKTGGLADTVFDVDASSLPKEQRNGFTFDHPDEHEIARTIDRAFDIYLNQPMIWKQLMVQGLKRDLSWNHAAKEYLKMYQQTIGQKSAAVLKR